MSVCLTDMNCSVSKGLKYINFCFLNANTNITAMSNKQKTKTKQNWPTPPHKYRMGCH